MACGESHSIVLTLDGKLWVSGSNEKYQLGINEEKDYVAWNFEEIKTLKGI